MNPVIGLTFVLVFFAAIGLPVMGLRYKRLQLLHRERMEAFERGIPIPQLPQRQPSLAPTLETYHLRGLIWTGVGLALSATLFFLLPAVVHRNQWERINEMRELNTLHYDQQEIRMFLNESDRRWESQHDRLRGLAALGLIPTAVGVAYLVFYYEQKRRFVLDPPLPVARLE